ncbi:thermonuclease family protein [Azotobacter salinestris]|uniref:thermonuclease family protein n=1 Tax=Azotobacter salinestris TaxID=69964 RepID=UPI001AD6A57A|nr:thermonuclease family protein [Azotobacter salinestris]
MRCFALLKKAPLAGAFFVSVAWGLPAQALCPAPDKLSTARVERVIDGDTLHLADGRRVRLIGVNTPERARREQPAEPFAEAARERLRQLVTANGGRVDLLPGRQARDRHGRLLAHAYDAHGRSWEAQLLAEGLGYQVAVAPNAALADCLRQAERRARAAGAGLWRQPAWQRPEQLRRGGFALIRARVGGVERNGGGLWIELEGGLVLRVEPKLLRLFDLAALQRLPGRRVETRGWVVDRARQGQVDKEQARWMLPLTHPFMLDVLP